MIVIPVLGFGTYQLTGEKAYSSVKYALEIGYRHIDTADIYGNHKEVGKALKDSKVERKDIFLTSKIWFANLEHNKLIDDCKRFLEEIDTTYLDLLLIHWPNKNIPLEETFAALNELKSQRLIRNIGVSNFTIKHLEKSIAITNEIKVNQVEFHPSLNQKELLEFCKANGISLTAYSPLARGDDLSLPEVIEIAKKHNASESQIILSWIRQKNIIAIPKASSNERILENYMSLKIELDQKDMEGLDKLNTNNRTIYPGFAEF